MQKYIFGGLMDTTRIAELAKMQGKSMTHLCSLIGKYRSYLNDVKVKNMKLPEEYIEMIANDLGTTPEYLLFKTDDPSVPSNADTGNESMIVFHRNGRRVVEHLTPKQMQMLTKMLDVIKDDDDDL